MRIDWRKFRSWQVRVVTLYSLQFGLSVLILLGFIYVTTVGYFDTQINENISAEADSFSETDRTQGHGALVNSLKQHIAENVPGGGVYLLTDPQYKPILGTIPRWPEDTEVQGRWLIFLVEQLNKSGEIDEQGYGRGKTLVLANGDHLLVGNNLQQRDEFNSLIFESLFWSLALMAILALIGGWLMSRDILNRIERVNNTTRYILGGDFAQRVPLNGSGDEFDRLATNLNNMLSKITQLMVSMREVTDNIAHDLRSPLTRIKSRLEASLVRQPKPQDYAMAIEAITQEVDQLLSTFNALLLIAQTEAGTGADLTQSVNLVKLCEDIAELYSPLVESKGQELILTIENPHLAAEVLGNRELLAQALINLIENAIKYSLDSPQDKTSEARESRAANRARTAPAAPEAAMASRPIGMKLLFEATKATIRISDHGRGIPSDQYDYVTQRFVRLEHSRTTAGNGLGLSLVKAVAKIHGAELLFKENPESTLLPGLIVEFVISLRN